MHASSAHSRPSRNRQVAAAAAVLALAGAYTVTVPGPAQAAPPDSNCTRTGSQVTCLWDQTGDYTFTVPAEVTSLDVTAIGGHGGDGGYNKYRYGGAGGKITGTVRGLADGEVLYLFVGGDGGSRSASNVPGGYNGGGIGGYWAGGGGGATDIRTATAHFATRVIVAGGGGGAGLYCDGGDAGNAGHGTGAGSAGTTPGGARGADETNGEDGNGALGAGGDADDNNGGGGGGYYGGGAGSQRCSGGGGSSMLNDTYIPQPTLATANEQPSIQIVYTPSSGGGFGSSIGSLGSLFGSS